MSESRKLSADSSMRSSVVKNCLPWGRLDRYSRRSRWCALTVDHAIDLLWRTDSDPGKSYMVSSNTDSEYQATLVHQVFRSVALAATACNASSRKSASTPSISKASSIAGSEEFFGSVNMRTSASLSNSPRVATTGQPTNSGIKPPRTKSSGSNVCRVSPIVDLSESPLTWAPKPIPDLSDDPLITLSSPAKTPPQINKILDVSTCRNSCCGYLRPPCGTRH